MDRYKHRVIRGGHGRGNGKRGRNPSIHGVSPFSDSSEEYFDSDEYHGHLHRSKPSHPHHPHGLPPGQQKKQNHHHPHPGRFEYINHLLDNNKNF